MRKGGIKRSARLALSPSQQTATRDGCQVCDRRRREATGVAERSGAILSACTCYIGSGIVLSPSTSLTATRTPTGSTHEDTSIRFLSPLRLLDRRSTGTSIRQGT